MGGPWLQEAFGCLLVAVLSLRQAAADASNSSLAAPGTAGLAVSQPLPGAQLGNALCWQGGYTAELCCRQDPLLNCWDAVYTFTRCCVAPLPAPSPQLPPLSPAASPASPVAEPPAPVQASASVPLAVRQSGPPVEQPAVPAAVEPLAPPKANGLPASAGLAELHPGDASKAAAGDASCWSGSFTYARCCLVPSVVAEVAGCWDSVHTEARCCQSAGPTGGAVDAFALPPRAKGVAAAAPAPVANAQPSSEPAASASPAAVTATSVAVRTLATAGSPHDSEGPEDAQNQAEFLRREGARRWPKYFQRAHRLLDAVLAPLAEREEGMEEAMVPDAVQVYHLLYEVVNQVIGGVQLASEATKASDTSSDSSATALRAAFLSAALVLARLAQVSQGTPFEHEEFATQAAAVVALSCGSRHDDQAIFQRRMARRIQWLQLEAEARAQPQGDKGSSWRTSLLETLRRRMNSTDIASSNLGALFERSWQMYAEDLVEAVWRPASGHPAEDELRHSDRSTLNPLEERLARRQSSAGDMWQIFSTYVMAKPLRNIFSRGKDAHSGGQASEGCPACAELARIVLEKYHQFELSMKNESLTSGSREAGDAPGRGSSRQMRPHEVNNAFFGWQLTHESEQEDERGQQQWPELYRDSEDFVELKHIAKLACLEYLQQVYDAPLSAQDLAQLELSIWASVTPQPSAAQSDSPGDGMGLAFHDHPLALLSGVFYAQAGGRRIDERTPTVFADPRGTRAFRYTRRQQQPGPSVAEDGVHSPHEPPGDTGATAGIQQEPVHGESSRARRARDGGDVEDTVEPTAPFHRLAYAHAYDGLALVFPSWLVHGVPPHSGSATRVTFAFNLHTLHGTTLSSWAKTTL
mmetsp:Transcript_10343/g.32171  ORF Transcript_10343/g.32171 Transcript_10343/m.32171 type:complete len:866 (+) Transcript_10343:102-2699(+)